MFESVGNLDDRRIGGIVFGILKVTSCFGIAHTFLLEVPKTCNRSSRQLVHIEGQSFRGWGCSECAWLFHPYDPPVGKSLDE
jgi:hypothetical protein